VACGNGTLTPNFLGSCLLLGVSLSRAGECQTAGEMLGQMVRCTLLCYRLPAGFFCLSVHSDKSAFSHDRHVNTGERDQRGGTYHRPSLILFLNCSEGSCRVWMGRWEEAMLEKNKGERILKGMTENHLLYLTKLSFDFTFVYAKWMQIFKT